MTELEEDELACRFVLMMDSMEVSRVMGAIRGKYPRGSARAAGYWNLSLSIDPVMAYIDELRVPLRGRHDEMMIALYERSLCRMERVNAEDAAHKIDRLYAHMKETMQGDFVRVGGELS